MRAWVWVDACVCVCVCVYVGGCGWAGTQERDLVAAVTVAQVGVLGVGGGCEPGGAVYLSQRHGDNDAVP